MSTIIEPTVGRIVWYRAKDGAIRAAIVVGVNSTFNLNLFVLGYSSSDRVDGYVDSVTHADPEQEPGCLPSWHWMPYQKQQAEKHATEAARADEPKAAAMPQSCGQVIGMLNIETGNTWGGTDMDFGTALLALKDGKRVARAGWNGKGMFVYLVPANAYPAQTAIAQAYFGQGAMVPYNAYLALKGADDTVSTWAPSGSDALAEDWLIVE